MTGIRKIMASPARAGNKKFAGDSGHEQAGRSFGFSESEQGARSFRTGTCFSDDIVLLFGEFSLEEFIFGMNCLDRGGA